MTTTPRPRRRLPHFVRRTRQFHTADHPAGGCVSFVVYGRYRIVRAVDPTLNVECCKIVFPRTEKVRPILERSYLRFRGGPR